MSSKQVAIQINHVSKLFLKQEQKTFKEFLPALLSGKKTKDQFWALRNIDLKINKGETIGVIGPNGSGKSTLLKLIAGVSNPTEGEIVVEGKIAPLIELGAGFHPELTGRENVFLNGIILGMKRSEVEACFQEIVDFAEIWDFIDQPVKHYSSGMYLRLAFAVAVHTQPEILLVDEILAVGDAAFQAKCFKKMDEFKQAGVTIIYVSHAIESVREFCDKVVYINKGKMVGFGESEAVVREYQNG